MAGKGGEGSRMSVCTTLLVMIGLGLVHGMGISSPARAAPGWQRTATDDAQAQQPGFRANGGAAEMIHDDGGRVGDDMDAGANADEVSEGIQEAPLLPRNTKFGVVSLTLPRTQYDGAMGEPCNAEQVAETVAWLTRGPERDLVGKFFICGADGKAKVEIARRVGAPFAAAMNFPRKQSCRDLGRPKLVVSRTPNQLPPFFSGIDTRDACAPKRSQIPTHFMTNLILLEDRKLILCVPPKNACTTIKAWARRVMGMPDMERQEMVHDREIAGITYLSDLAPQRANALLHDESYTRVAVLREPAERLLSSFLNKIVLQNIVEPGMWISQLRNVAGARRKDVQELGDRLLSDPKFADFVELVEAALLANRLRVNEHFAPQADICLLPMVKYNRIVNFHNLTAEINRVNDDFGLHSPLPHKAMHSTNATNLLQQYASPELIARMRRLYSMDISVMSPDVWPEAFAHLGSARWKRHRNFRVPRSAQNRKRQRPMRRMGRSRRNGIGR